MDFENVPRVLYPEMEGWDLCITNTNWSRLVEIIRVCKRRALVKIMQAGLQRPDKLPFKLSVSLALVLFYCP